MTEATIQARSESRARVIVDPERLPLDTSSYEVEKFPQPYSHTLYFGFPDGTFPNGFAFRIRAYGESLTPTQSGNVAILDLQQPCYLEIKHPIEGLPGTRKKVRHQTTVGAAIDAAQSLEKVLSIFEAELPETIQEQLRQFYATDQRCQPLCGVSYERTHFINSHRITVDHNIQSFAVVQYDGNWFIRKGEQEPYSMMEIKSALSPAGEEANISKFKVSNCMTGEALHVEPGMNMIEDGNWELLERELKIDTVADPRDTLKQVAGSAEISVGPWKANKPTLMQFVKVGENGICIMGRVGVTEKMAIKHKTTISSSAGVITRTERVQPYSQEKLDEIIRELGGDPETVERSAYVSRNRVIRLVVCESTGNIFAITADRCISEDEQIPDLNQVEVEYRGKIARTTEQTIDAAEVDADFEKVSRWLYQEYRKKQQVPQLSTVTKYEWSTGQVAVTQPKPESVRQGNNARLEFDYEAQQVRKTFDLWGAVVDSQQIIMNYLAFRTQAAQLYNLPEMHDIQHDGNSLRVTESLIDGKMAKTVLAEGSEAETIAFIKAALMPLQGQIMPDTEFDLGTDRVSRRPLALPIDIKPDNFVITPTGEVYFVDLFPPLNRQEDGSLVATYGAKDGKHDAWVYGEASVLITRFLMRCLMANPSRCELMTRTVLEIVAQIDQSGLLLTELQRNAQREKTITDFGKVENGVRALVLIATQ